MYRIADTDLLVLFALTISYSATRLRPPPPPAPGLYAGTIRVALLQQQRFVKTTRGNLEELRVCRVTQQGTIDEQMALLVDQGNLALGLKSELEVGEVTHAITRQG